MTRGKRSGVPKEKTWVQASRDQTRLPDWLAHPFARHEPTYNPTIKVGTLRWALIWGTARYPKTSFAFLLALPLLAWAVFFAFSLAQPEDTLIPYALGELGLLVVLFWSLWPLLLYRLCGLPKPALRPSDRSATQQTARRYAQVSGVALALLIANIIALWLWTVNFVMGSDVDAIGLGGAVVLFVVVPALLLFGYPLFKALRILFKKPRRERPQSQNDLVPDEPGRRPRRRKVAAQQPNPFPDTRAPDI